MGDKGKKDRERDRKQKAKRKDDQAKAKQEKSHKDPSQLGKLLSRGASASR